ncbi:MAG TPA: sigma-70 family RNA polymerase sigma factor [Candidatus Limnocylindrales bacterium]
MTVERALVERAAQGDREAFDVIISGVVDRLFAIARLILHDADRAEDAVQDTLVACWRDLPSLRDPDRFDAWLRRLLINHVNDEFKRGRRQAATIAVLRVEPSLSDASGEVAIRDLLQRGFQRLSLDHRTVIVLRYYLGLSIEETAASLGIPAGTAKSRLHYATEAMRLALEADARPPVREVSA